MAARYLIRRRDGSQALAATQESLDQTQGALYARRVSGWPRKGSLLSEAIKSLLLCEHRTYQEVGATSILQIAFPQELSSYSKM